MYTVATELHDDGLTASTVAKIDGLYANPVCTLSGFMEGLVVEWRGWNGVRTWTSLERELALDARHDGRGHVSLGVTLRAPGLDLDDTAWSARSVFVLEAGEELTRLAADLSYLLRTWPPLRLSHVWRSLPPAELQMRFGFTAHPGFKSPILRR
ncbi:DUF6228 family protein [Nonomuraea jiangxiensis]|uniref:DUF6228 family protein n=1 Tax=Nonomuraea jiangxiensis TaxID=633440 RepID=UPI000B86D8FD